MAPSSLPEIRRQIIEVESRGVTLPMAGVAFGDAARPLDVIFLHANGFNGLTYRHALEPLADQLHILSVDQRGHGRTPQAKPAHGRADILDLRDDLLGLIEVLASERPVVLSGHSLGGCIALLAAAERPDRVRSIALFDPVILPPEVSARTKARNPTDPEPEIASRARARRTIFASRDAAFDAYRRATAFATWPAEMLRDYIEDGFCARPDGQVELICAPEWEASNFVAHGHDVWPDLARIRAPVTILRASTGSTCSLSRAEEFPGHAEVAVETIEGAGHFLPMERPDLVRSTLLRAAG
jgi:pimeloyl-ACP methyl ester carboxylesterase